MERQRKKEAVEGIIGGGDHLLTMALEFINAYPNYFLEAEILTGYQSDASFTEFVEILKRGGFLHDIFKEFHFETMNLKKYSENREFWGSMGIATYAEERALFSFAKGISRMETLSNIAKPFS